MGLEHDDETTVDAGAGGGKDGRDLGRVMTVVVYDHDAVFFAEPLKAPIRALKLFQRRGDLREGDANLEPHCNRSQRVEHVVPPWHLQPQFAELDISPDAASSPSGVQYRTTAREPNASSVKPWPVTLAEACPSALARP